MEVASTNPLPGEPQLVRELAQRFASASIGLPMLSEVAQQVIRATSDEQADAKALSDLIRKDPPLAGNLLGIANSSLYAPPTRIVSLQQAISRLGVKRIRDIALMVSMQTRVFEVPGLERQVRGVFRHSIATAMFAEDIARLRRLNVEEAFLLGLFHDVGTPLALLESMMAWSASGLARATSQNNSPP